jgi:chemotaxis protein MotA
VGSANLFFLPASGKMKIRIREEQLLREMTLEGVISILEGMNPRMVESRLEAFLAPEKRESSEGRSGKARAASA